MSQKWFGKEHPIKIPDVAPGESASCDLVIRPGSRPFRVTSVIADAEGFRLIQCVAGRRALVKDKDGAAFPATRLFGAVEVGEAITTTVRNESAESRSFAGKLVGEELLSR